MPNIVTTRSSTSPPGVIEQFDEGTFLIHDHEGLHAGSRRNLTQLLVVVLFIAVGAVVGSLMTEDRPDIAALAGGVLGMIVGTLVSGLVLMFLPTPRRTLTREQLRSKCRWMRLRFIVAATMFAAVLISFPFIMLHFRNDNSDLALIVCTLWCVAWLGLCVYAKTLAARMRDWKCPTCGKLFGKRGNSCSTCALSSNAEAEV